MQYLFDDNGRRYVGAFGGIATVCCGHCHPDVVKAVTDQTKILQYSTILYFNHAIADFAEALASKLPGDLKGVGGIVELAPGYLPAVYQSVRNAGGLCIADEVQSGFARTGSHFWGFESHDVVPDIVTMSMNSIIAH